MNVVLVFVGGGIGASARYGLQGVVHRFLGSAFPYGTLLVNILGCLAIGVLMTSLEERFTMNPSLRIFLAIGVLGGFTTFSSFSYETMMLFREGSIVTGLLNVGANTITCLAATWLGMAAGKLI